MSEAISGAPFDAIPRMSLRSCGLRPSTAQPLYDNPSAPDKGAFRRAVYAALLHVGLETAPVYRLLADAVKKGLENIAEH
jgi:hypothetical protein